MRYAYAQSEDLDTQAMVPRLHGAAPVYAFWMAHPNWGEHAMVGTGSHLGLCRSSDHGVVFQCALMHAG